MQRVGAILVLGVSVMLCGFDDVDPGAAEYPSGHVARSVLLQADDLLSSRYDDGRRVRVNEYGFRDGDHYCGEYETRSSGATAWARHWFLARFDDIESATEAGGLLPLSLTRVDASPADVSAWCPRLSGSGDFSTLMTPQNWAVPAKHLASVRAPLHAGLQSAFDAALEDTGVAASLGGVTRVRPESASRICGVVPMRLRADYTTQHQIGFSADIEAVRVEADDTDPFPRWDVRIVDLRLLAGWDEVMTSCPSLDPARPDGYGSAGGLGHTVSPDDALEAHRNRQRVCHFRENADPNFPADIPGGACHFQPEQAMMETGRSSPGR